MIDVANPITLAPADILFQDRVALQVLLFRERQLSKALITQRAKQLLGEVLGQPPGPATTALPEPRPADGPAA